MIKHYFGLVLLVAVFLVKSHEKKNLAPYALSQQKHPSIMLKNHYGIFEITEPVLCDLLECPSVKRLDEINQYGIDAYVNTFPRYTRYQHSVGVMCILRRFGASIQEQIAGLLHDVSHTVFSHVGDHLFGATCNALNIIDSKDSYQDAIHGWFMQQTEIANILAKYGYAVEDIIHKNGMFMMLEQDVPDLCADRIEYNLYGGFIENRITCDEIAFILDALRYKEGYWFFVDRNAARILGDTALFLTEHHFGTSWNALLNTWAAQALRRALDVGIVSAHDIHFSTDDIVWHAMNRSDDQLIKSLLAKLYHYKNCYHEVAKTEPYDYIIYPKFRGINPLVQQGDQSLRRLYDLDNEYKTEFDRIKLCLMQGRAVRIYP